MKHTFTYSTTVDRSAAKPLKAKATIADFKGFLEGIAFHSFPKMNGNFAGFTEATIARSLHTLVDTPLNFHHTQWDITGFIKAASLGAANFRGVKPVNISSIIWPGVDIQTFILNDVVESAKAGDGRFKLSMEVQFDSWQYVAFNPNAKPEDQDFMPVILEDEALNEKMPDDVVGGVIPMGEHAGKLIGILIGGLDGDIVFNGVAITIEEIGPAADQEAVITDAGNISELAARAKVESSGKLVANVGTSESFSVAAVSTKLKNTNKNLKEIHMDFSKMSITELLSVEAEHSAAALDYLKENFTRTPEVEVASADEPTNDLAPLMDKMDKILEVLTPAASEEEVASVEEDEIDPKDEQIAELSQELTEHRMDEMEDLLGAEFLANAENKKRTENKIRSLNTVAYKQYCDELKAIAKAQKEKLSKAEDAPTVTTRATEDNSIGGIKFGNFKFTNKENK